MSPGNRAIDTMIAAYNAEYNEEEYKDPSLNIALVETHYPEIINNGGYRQSAISVELPIKYQHVKIVNGIESIDSCSLPGWWATLFISKWQCPICSGKWEIMNLFDYEFWEKSE